MSAAHVARDVEALQTPATSIVVRLFSAHNVLLQALRRGMGETSLARFDLLATLAREDGQTLAALSRKLLVTAGSITGLVHRAERDGVVVRRADARDGRLTRVNLTPKGHRLAAQSIRRHAALAEEILAALDRREREQLRALLSRLRLSVDAYAKSPTKRGRK